MRLSTTSVTFFRNEKSKYSRNDDFYAALLIFLQIEELRKIRYLSKTALEKQIRILKKDSQRFEAFKAEIKNLSLDYAEKKFGIRIFMWRVPGPQRAPECWRKGSENQSVPRLDLLCQRSTKSLWYV